MLNAGETEPTVSEFNTAGIQISDEFTYEYDENGNIVKASDGFMAYYFEYQPVGGNAEDKANVASSEK